MPPVQTNGVETYYERRGDGPPLVFVHGAVAGLRYFETQLTGLSDDYRTISFDFRGSRPVGEDGARPHDPAVRSRRRGVPRSPRPRRRRPGRLVDGRDRHVGVRRPARDGPPARDGRRRHGTVARQAPGPRARQLRSRAAPGGPRSDPDRPLALAEENVDALCKDPPSRELRTTMFDEGTRTPPPIQAAMLLELFRDYRDVLPRIDVPTLVCAGADEKWRTVASVEYAAELLPDARFELFGESGHCITLEEPERFNDVLRAFVAGL